MVAAYVVTYPKRVVAGRGKLSQGVIAQWFAVGAQRDGGVGCKERAVEHQMVDMDESFFGVLGLGLRRGKVDGDGIELACGKQLRQRCGASGQDECVGQFLLADFLRGIGDTDGLLVHTDKEGVWLVGRALYKVRSLAAAKIQVKVFEWLAACGRTGLAPISGIGLGARLNRIGVAFQALFEHKVLRRANVDGSHEAPWS